MKYDILIETISEILSNPKIYKDGMTITYELDDTMHIKFNEDLFYRTNPPSSIPPITEIIEVELGGILIKFVKKIKK